MACSTVNFTFTFTAEEGASWSYSTAVSFGSRSETVRRTENRGNMLGFGGLGGGEG